MERIAAIAGVVDGELTAFVDEDGLARLHARVGCGMGGDEIEIVLDGERMVVLAMALLGGLGGSAAERLPCAVGMRRVSLSAA